MVVAYEPVRDLFSLRTQGFLREGRGNVERIDRLIDRLSDSSRAHPDSFIAYMRGMLLLVRGRLTEASEAFASAENQYSAFGGFATAAAFAAARCDYERHVNGAEGALERSVEHMRVRLERGPLRPKHAAALFEIAMAGKDFESARRLLVAGDPSKPSTPRLLIAKAKIELAAANYLEALRLIEDVPELAAEHIEAAKIKRQCVEKLAELVNDHQPEPASAK
jgi:hypothetical protein